MNKRMTACGVVFATMSLLGVAAAKPGAKLVAAADLKWADVPGMAGVHMSVADGDPAKGPSHFFLKFDKGFTAPEHFHTADHYGTVVAGTLVLTVDGTAARVPPGSYFSFTGKKPHATSCDPAADCVLQIDARGKWDVQPSKKSAEPPKPTK